MGIPFFQTKPGAAGPSSGEWGFLWGDRCHFLLALRTSFSFQKHSVHKYPKSRVGLRFLAPRLGVSQKLAPCWPLPALTTPTKQRRLLPIQAVTPPSTAPAPGTAL